LGWTIPDHPSMASQDRRIPAAPLCSLGLYDQGQVVQVDWWMPPCALIHSVWSQPDRRGVAVGDTNNGGHISD
jgi:hypothetical protein